MADGSRRILFLVKVFGDEVHARAFMDGELFARRLSYFKGLDGSDIRRDEDEGAVMLQREGGVLELTAKNPETGEILSSIRIPGSQLAAPLTIRPGWANHINLFCMYAGHSGDTDNIADSTAEHFQRQLTIPEGVLERFGEHAVVIYNAKEFFRRVALGAKQMGYGIKGQLVTYYDAVAGMPATLPYEDAVFAKRNEYSHEREFRIVIDTGNVGTSPVTLFIGGISDIATYAGNPSKITAGRLRVEFDPK